jgi:hypothetical protein
LYTALDAFAQNYFGSHTDGDAVHAERGPRIQQRTKKGHLYP